MAISKILIIDDEELFREDLATILTSKGYVCETAENPNTAMAKLTEFNPDIILSDIMMPGKSGLELLEEIKSILPSVSVIMMTAYGTLETAVEAFRKGAADYILKPLVIEDLTNKLKRLEEFNRLTQEVEYLRRRINSGVSENSFVFESPRMKAILAEVEKVAPKMSNILISGESGTGKEVIAKLIHDLSGRKEEPFIAINCAGLQENLLESELFGHAKGAFTGAVSDKAGFFEIAGEGTIFLDEISEMPLLLQSKLLRVLEQREFYRVGDTKVIQMKARIITATNKDLISEVKKGEFREDLFYRIAVFEIKIPPLRERKEDIALLTNFFIDVYNKEIKSNIKGVEPEVLKLFLNYKWPGNIRELRNIIERAMILSSGELISADNLPEQLKGKFSGIGEAVSFKAAVQAFEKNYILSVLNRCNWNREETARNLDINPSTLYRKMSEYNISEKLS